MSGDLYAGAALERGLRVGCCGTLVVVVVREPAIDVPPWLVLAPNMRPSSRWSLCSYGKEMGPHSFLNIVSVICMVSLPTPVSGSRKPVNDPAKLASSASLPLT
jgi:hypothetical protein